jgi:hypothetical protein
MPETPKDPKKRPTSDKPTSSEAPETHMLSLVKGGHHFCFRYETGDEPRVLEVLVEMVHRRELKFDWFDAAVLSHQLGQHLAKELRGYLPKKAA